ncbi:MAG: hypothetical protein FWF01_00745 [Alphaproteobacteria bacterium]|nr:hypothetical protein [Alphaproteobacteria bacterium]
MGTWFLYEISSKDSQARYLLKTSKEAFFLNEQGEKISLVQDKEPYQIKNIVYFSDLPKPPSVQDNYAI